VTVALAAVPGSASAAIRTGSIQDPQGDASAFTGPVLDIQSVAVDYDDAAGTVRVAWTYFDDVRAKDPSLDGGLWLDAASSASPSARVGWSRVAEAGGTSSLHASLTLGGTNGSLPGTTTVSEDGHTVTAAFSHAQLVGRDWQIGDGSIASGDTVLRFWFDGYAPVSPPPPVAPTPTPPAPAGTPESDLGMTINNGAQYTNDPDVTLSIIAPTWASALRLANDGGFRAAKTVAVAGSVAWRLAESGPERLPKTVYLRFGGQAQTFTDDIILDQTKPTVTAATVSGSSATVSSAAVASASVTKSRNYRVRVRATDQTSGVAMVQFASDRRRPAAQQSFERVNRYRATAAPKYVRVLDRAGNYSRWQHIR